MSRLSAWVVLSVAVHAGLVVGVLALIAVVAPAPMLFVDLVDGFAAADEAAPPERTGPEGGARMPGGARARAASAPAGPARRAVRAPGLEPRPQAMVSTPEPPVQIPPVAPRSEPARPPAETAPTLPPPAPAPPEPAPVVEPILPARPARVAEPLPAVSQPGPPAASASPAPRATEPAAPSAFAGSSRPGGAAKGSAPPDSASAGGGGAARSPDGGAPGRGDGGGLALAVPGAGADAAEYGAYLAVVRRRIHERLTYPSSARHRGLSGTVQIEIEIAASGALGRVSLAASSSHGVLDEAALDAARGLRRVPFPPDVRPRPLRVRLPVVFELR